MKVLKQLALFVMALFLVGCTNTVGNNVVNDKGELVGDKLDWPKIEDAYQEEGIFPNMSNLENISKGMSKEELYYLIERPHFSEMNGADEWNYIMKFKKHDGSVKVCQYKILFDEDDRAQSFFWKPKNCLEKPVEKVVINSDTLFPVFPKADALFPSNMGSTEHIMQTGKEQLNELARKILKSKGNPKVLLVGHADFRGSYAYNMELSKKRALSVKNYLVSRGVNQNDIKCDWKGESEPVKECSSSLKGQALIKCLQPNRRVSVEITRDYLNPR